MLRYLITQKQNKKKIIVIWITNKYVKTGWWLPNIVISILNVKTRSHQRSSTVSRRIHTFEINNVYKEMAVPEYFWKCGHKAKCRMRVSSLFSFIHFLTFKNISVRQSYPQPFPFRQLVWPPPVHVQSVIVKVAKLKMFD